MLTKCNATIVLTVILLTPLATQGLPNWDIFDDTVIEEGDAYNIVNVYDTPPAHTTVNITGGLIDVLHLFDASTLNATGGRIMTLGATDYATLNISGQPDIWTAGGDAWSTVNISGGTLQHASVSDHATLNLSGGSLSQVVVGPRSVLNASGSPTIDRITVVGVANVNGGDIGMLDLSTVAVLNLYGGNISEGIFAPPRRGAQAEFAGTINVYGRGLAKTDTGGEYGFGQVYGTYLDDSRFLIDLAEGVYPHVNLVPEPATLLLLAVGGLIHRYCEHSTRTHARTGGDVC